MPIGSSKLCRDDWSPVTVYGTFLDLQVGQPTVDPAYKGATPAIFVQGKGITCDPPPASDVLNGKTTSADNVDEPYDRYLPAT
jgi:hypothetical protein